MKLTVAGAKVLAAFDKRPDDVWNITSLFMSEISRRSRVWSPQVYKVVEKLVRDGYLNGYATHDGMRYRRIDNPKEF